jgi:6-pyruvoyltetrahydropterin/6-carboxytetrahydropterin synthase
MVYDFSDLKKHLRELAERFDHRNLNDVHPFTEIESTAENQARYFFDELKERLPVELAEGLIYARVSESPGQWAQYGG